MFKDLQAFYDAYRVKHNATDRNEKMLELLFLHLPILSAHFELPEFNILEGRVECATTESAGFDLFSTIDISVSDTPVAVPTGVYAKFDKGLMAILKEKSGLAAKHNVDVKAGLIDADFDGSQLQPDGSRNPKFEWKVVLRCLTPGGFRICAGDNIAQFVIVKKPKIKTSGITFRKDIRVGGFGSTASN